MSNKRQGLLILHEHLCSLPGFDWACDAHLFSFLCLCFVCLRPVFCVPNVAIAHSLLPLIFILLRGPVWLGSWIT